MLAGLVPSQRAAPPARESITTAQLVRIERVLPTPAPRPPRPPRRVVTHARVIATIEPRAIVRAPAGVSARREIVKRAGAARPAPPKLVQTKPVWDVPTGAAGAGAGAASGAGSVGAGGNGTGAGTNGAGTGAAGGTEPCGYVEFADVHGSQYDARTGGFWVDISMTVRFPDGHAESTVLDYPFYYPSEAANPWSSANLKNPSYAAIEFQMPPPAKRDAEPALVQYVMAHTTAEGYTKLKPCPASP